MQNFYPLFRIGGEGIEPRVVSYDERNDVLTLVGPDQTPTVFGDERATLQRLGLLAEQIPRTQDREPVSSFEVLVEPLEAARHPRFLPVFTQLYTAGQRAGSEGEIAVWGALFAALGPERAELIEAEAQRVDERLQLEARKNRPILEIIGSDERPALQVLPTREEDRFVLRTRLNEGLVRLSEVFDTLVRAAEGYEADAWRIPPGDGAVLPDNSRFLLGRLHDHSELGAVIEASLAGRADGAAVRERLESAAAEHRLDVLADPDPRRRDHAYALLLRRHGNHLKITDDVTRHPDHDGPSQVRLAERPSNERDERSECLIQEEWHSAGRSTRQRRVMTRGDSLAVETSEENRNEAGRLHSFGGAPSTRVEVLGSERDEVRRSWHVDGVLQREQRIVIEHRKRGAAYREDWRDRKGQLHRETGPAVIVQTLHDRLDGRPQKPAIYEHWIHGRQVSAQKFDRKTAAVRTGQISATR